MYDSLEYLPNAQQTALALTVTKKHTPISHRTKPTEIIVSPGELVQVLNEDAVVGAIPSCYFTFIDQPAPSTTIIDCQSLCPDLEASSFESVGDAVDYWMGSEKEFSASAILDICGLLEVTHQPITALSNAECIRLQALHAVLRGDEILVFDSPWAEEDMDIFILDLLRFLRQHHTSRNVLPAFVVRDCGDLISLYVLSNTIWEVEDGQAIGVEIDCGGL